MVKNIKGTKKEHLRIIPLGGVEEIGGLNMTVIEYGSQAIVIDAGLMFPDDDMLGVDLVIQDLTYLREFDKEILAVILTHGHEDHVGGLPFFLKEFRVPVFGTALTLGFVQHKLNEHNIQGIELNRIRPRDVEEIGPFEIEFIRMTHSIVDGVGLGIMTPHGRIVHTGDFKIDPTPVDGELMDFQKLAQYGAEGALLMLSDSTNSERRGYTFSEKEVRRAFEDIFSKAEGRIILSTFSSNIHRIQQAIDVAAMYDRKVIVCGRSVSQNTEIAINLGYLRIPKGTLLGMDALRGLDDDEVVLITTGSQGEPRSVLSRISIGEHKQVKIGPGDTVVLSSKAIPGNERAIGKIINRLSRLGADVIHEEVSEVHVSGHASREELKMALNIVRPRYFMPVHGEYRNLANHAKIAQKLGIPKKNTFIMKNGEVLSITDKKAKLVDKVKAGRVFIDGKGVGDVEEMVLRDRRRMGHDGIVIVLLTVEKESGILAVMPDVITRGFVMEGEAQEISSTLQQLIADNIQQMDSEIISDPSLLKDKVRSMVRKHLRTTKQRRPMVVPVVYET